MSVDKTDFGLVLYNHANFYRFEEISTYWSVKRISVFLCFSLVNQRHTSCIPVHNCTVTNIENTVLAVHRCNSCFHFISGLYLSSHLKYFNDTLKDYRTGLHGVSHARRMKTAFLHYLP